MGSWAFAGLRFHRGRSFVADQSTSLSLLQRVRYQNPEAWERLIYLYSPLIDHWFRAWGVQGDDVDDLRQEVFQAVFAGLKGFRRDRPGDTFRGWLRVIARRKFVDLCRRRQGQPSAAGGSEANLRLQQFPEPEEMPADDSPEEVTLLHRRALEMVRSQVEERTWQAFWRCAVEAQAVADVAHDLGMTPVAVRKAKSRVLHRLKEELGEVLE